MDVSTDQARDTDSPAAAQTGMVAAAGMATVSRSSPGAGRFARTVGFHLFALACFTVPAVLLWWRVWSGHPTAR